MNNNKWFAQQVEKNVGCAVILAGSGSDEAHIDKIVKGLNNYSIPFEVRVASAHKQPLTADEIVQEYDSLQGALVYITVAGSTDALSGTGSFRSWRPVVSCPPDHPNMSCITNPPLSSNAYIGRPENAARFVAQLFAAQNELYREVLKKELESKISQLRSDDIRLREKYERAQKTGWDPSTVGRWSHGK